MASEQITYADEQAELPNALEDSEIARIMKLVSGSGYKKSENAPTRIKQEFKPRSLVEIAMEAQKKLDNEDKKSKNESVQTKGAKQTIDTDTDTDTDTDKNGDETVKALSAEIEEKDSEQIESPSSLPGNNDIELADEQIGLNSAIRGDNDTTISSQSSESSITEPIADYSDGAQSEESSIPDNIETHTSQSTDELTVQYNKGYKDGIEAGKNEREIELQEKFSSQLSILDALISNFTKNNYADTELLEKDIRTTILSLASERAGFAIKEMPEHFLKRIDTLISRVGTSSKNPIIKLNKADLNYVEMVKEKSETLSKFTFSEDETLNHGDVALSLGGIEIEDIIEKRISPTPIETNEGKNTIPEVVTKSKSEISNSSDTLVGRNEQDAKLNDTENKSTQQIKSDDRLEVVEHEDEVKGKKKNESESDITNENSSEKIQDKSS